MDFTGFISTINTLCEITPDLKSKILSNIDGPRLIEKCSEQEQNIILHNLSICILDPKYRKCIIPHVKPWLLEILSLIKSLIGSYKKGNLCNATHTALCVCLGNIESDDVQRFAKQYFREAPSSFYSLSQVTKSPASKKLKLSYDIPIVTELEVLEATYNLLLCIGAEISNHWEFASLLKYFNHEDSKIRWFACNCVALFLNMSELEKKSLLAKYVTDELQVEFATTSCLDSMNYVKCVDVPNAGAISSQYTCCIGRVVLPLYKGTNNKSKTNTLILLPSTQQNLENIALGISSNRPVLVEGLVGSGKTNLIVYLASQTGRTKAPFLSKIQLSDQTDSKTLIGTYRCTANPGEFIWQAGSVTQAVLEGYWLLLEDIDFAPLDVISLLIPLLESRILPVPGLGNIKAHPDFQIFATRRILPAGCRMRIGSANLIEKLWTKIPLCPLSYTELKQLICENWPELESISEKLVEVYMILSSGQHGEETGVEKCGQCGTVNLTSAKASGRFVSVRDLMKWCSRMVSHIAEKELNVRAFQEAVDCFCSAVSDSKLRYNFALHIGSHLNINEALVNHFLNKDKPEVGNKAYHFTVGTRGRLLRLKKNHVSLNTEQTTFSKTRLSSCLLEKVTVAVMKEEPVLLVGETGTGKTSIIQYLARHTNHSLRVINLNQQSDSSDLLGGFKPVEIRSVVAPLKQEFEESFINTFSAKKNTKFLGHIMATFARQKWEDLFLLIKHSKEKAMIKLSEEKKESKGNKNSEGKKTIKEIVRLIQQWSDLESKLETIKDQVKKVKSSLAFAYIEGSLVKAVKRGEWVLLDEINLASADTLESLSGLLESSTGSLTLHERGDSKPLQRHPDFRLFACMNPATDVGKKELPAGLRNRFSEFFVEEIRDVEDLKQIVFEYLKDLDPSPKQIIGIVKFYMEVKKLSTTLLNDATGHKPHFSLRTLCRALIVARKNPCKNFNRSLFEAFSLAFLTQLDQESYRKIAELIQSTFKAKTNTPLPAPEKESEFVPVEGFWVPVGNLSPVVPEKYILTPTVRSNLKDLVRIVSIGRFPVLLQGDTSVGKTSLITYLAKLTGNHCVRINNHQHTDLQEYVGSYAPDQTGKLVFKEGILVQAMRKGDWVILDELNLAPSDVLEALNRLLDDNRELFIPEIETVVKAHPKFMLFATQNPPGLYGGRQVLSRAFRNRFVELHFDVIPPTELQVILKERCDIPDSLSKKMVLVLQDLQNRRRASNLCQGKQSFITLRDLFRWAERYRLAPKITTFYDWDQHMADEGYLVLAGKIRVEEETDAIVDVLKKRLRKDVKVENLFNISSETSLVSKPVLEKLELIKGFEHIVWTFDMRRLFVLISKALSFCEPVLLVGETGCGKTTVCQMIASMKEQKLYTVNCHMHTEGADFLGGLRPVRDRKSEDDDRLFEWVDGSLIQALRDGGMFLADEISLADDSVLERLNSVLEPERTLVLAEKAGDEWDECLETIVAHEQFRLVGTMNPGGDYGKKELSPALRNRLTEIWCPKVEIRRSTDDVKLIIKHNIEKSLNQETNIEQQMVLFLKYFTETELGKKITVSIRDILSWVFFINKVVSNSTLPIDIGIAYIHGACLILLDGLGSGATGSSVQNWRNTREKALKCLYSQAQKLSQKTLDPSGLTDVKDFVLRNDSEKFGIEPFAIPKGNSKTNSLTFAFEAPMTCLNLLRLLRGLQLSRPILLEGSPGVGKTSLVIALAKASNNDIVRINLSEQTDVSDLFGADLPVEGGEGGRFAWRDGPLLQALKDGWWVVLDELNLASQSVLEGLNACFDHRGEIYIPELNKTFVVQHQLTKIFACQNPQCEGGARKGLPKSFLNRFTQVYVEPLSAFDLEFILGAIHSQIPREVVSKMVKFNDTLIEEIQDRKIWGTKGGPWELNLRDMFRWCEMTIAREKTVGSGFNPGDFVDFIYADRMRTESDKEEVYRVYSTIFPCDEYPLYKKSGTFRISEKSIQIGRAVLQRKTTGIEWKENINCDLFILHGQTPYLESLINSINMNWMTLLVGPSSEGKSSLVWLLSRLAGQRLETMSVNSHMDVTELLGGFEQADYGRRLSELVESLQQIVWQEVRRNLLRKKNMKVASEFLSLWKQLCEIKDTKIRKTTTEEVKHFVNVCHAVQQLIDCLEQNISSSKIKKLRYFRKTCNNLCKKVQSTSTVSGGGTFEWVDSPLVKAVRNGYWLLIDGVNLCSPSVLDRLNGLLEPGGVLTMSERGVVSSEVPVITPHPNFRLFLTMDPQHGEISRAMRNRGIEVFVLGMWQHDWDVRSLLLSHGLKDEKVQSFLTRVYSDICHALSGPEKPNISCLTQSAALTKRLLELGQPLLDALDLSLRLAYVRNSSSIGSKNKVQQVINRSLQNFEKTSTRRMSSNTSICCLNSKTLLQCSWLGLPVQLAALMNSISITLLSPKSLAKAALPGALPCSRNGYGVSLFHMLSTVPLHHWNTFITALENYNKKHGKIIAKASKGIASDSSVTFQLLENICDGELAADPRFNFTALCMKVGCSDLKTIFSLANKALIGLELKIEEAVSTKKKYLDKRKWKNEKASDKRADSVYELSVKISKGLLGEKMIYHPSLKYLAHLLHCITSLIKDLSDNTEVELNDSEYFKLREALTWKRRLLILCEQTVSKDNFHKFLPELIFHWKNLQDMLLDQIPPTWNSLLPEEMCSVVCKLKEAFSANCSPLHNLIPEIRNHIGFPSPFTCESSAADVTKLYEISQSMTPYIGYDNEKEVEKVAFLASENGSEIKTRLLDVAFDMLGSTVVKSTEDLEDLEKTLNEILSKEFSKTNLHLNNVKLWPLLDYFVSKQLTLTNIFGLNGVPLSECRDVLAKASSIPVLLVSNSDSSSSMAAVVLYLFNISNCSALYPGSWLNYDNLIAEDNNKTVVSASWEGEKNFVLSQMGCNLAYQLLCGVPEKEAGFMSVGNHAEREIQLGKIRKTLWKNWTILSDPNNNYALRFKDSVITFTSNLLKSLLKTLKGPASAVQNNMDIFAATDELIVSCKDVLGTEGQILLQEIKTLGDTTSSSDGFFYTQLGVFAGLLQSWLLSHIEPLDPAQRRALLLSYYEDELNKFEDSLTLFNWIKILTYSHSLEDLHPHYRFYEDAVTELKSKIASISQNVAFRPESSQYSEILHEITHFVKTLFLPSRVCEIVKGLTNNAGNVLDLLRQCEASLRSCDNFIKNMLYSYPLYRDLTVPVLHGIVIACESLRALMVLARNKDLSLTIEREIANTSFDEILSSMLYFPHLRKGESGDFLLQKVSDQNCISYLIKENSSSSHYANQCQSLALRASFYDLFNHISSQKFFTKDSFSFMKGLLENIVACWREQEMERKRKAQEEESLFIYKPRNLAISETEEEEIQREYLELFPDYANEFKDLDYLADGDDDDDVEEVQSYEESEIDELQLTDEYLNEVIEVHRILISNFIETSWMVSHKQAETKPITPVILRTNQVQLLMKLIGPFGTQNVDCAAVGSLTMSNYVSSSVVKNSVNISVVQKQFNYYHDSDLEETLKVRPLLETLDNKANDLLEKWPSHPSLLMIKKVIDRVLNFAVTSPLIRLVIGLEMVLEKAQEWEKNAHKGVSLMAELTPITEQVIEWRKIELKAWRSCLDMITEKVFNEANKFWPHLYESFLSVNSENVNDLIQALKQFMESSVIGDYQRRLQVLKAFHCHLCLEWKHCMDSSHEILEKLIAITWNFYKYYQQFLPLVDETLKKEKKPIEKKVKEFIKILKWNDINFFSVRDSVIKSRRTLHRHMRDWEKVLRRPFSPLLLDQTDDAERNKGEWDSEKVSLSIITKPVDVEVCPVMVAEENLLVHRLPSLTKRSFDLTNKIIDSMPYTDNIVGVEEMAIDILSTYDDLIVATSKAENLSTKDERIKSLKEIMNRKKKTLSNLFKSLHHQGVSYTKGNSLWKEDDIDNCLIVPPLDIKVALREITDLKVSNKCLQSCDKYFYKSIGRQALLLKSLQQAHRDLKPEDIKRLKGVASHFLLLLRQMRGVIPDLCSTTFEVDYIVKEIDKATAAYVPVYDDFSVWWKKIYSLMSMLSLNLEEEIKLFETYPDCSSLLEIISKTPSITELEVQNVLIDLKIIFSELNELKDYSLKINMSLSNYYVKLPSLENIEDLAVVFSKLSKLEEKLSNCIKIFDENFSGTTSLSKPFIDWICGWKETFDKFCSWKADLIPVCDQDYVSSDNIEICLVKILKCIEDLFKHHCQKVCDTSDDVDVLTLGLISQGIVQFLISDCERLRGKEIKQALLGLINELNTNSNTSVLIALKSMKPLLQQYLTMSKNVVAAIAEGFRSLSKLHSILLGIFQQIATKGFCRSEEAEEEQEGDREGDATQFQDSGPGLSAGDGMKDVSERYESEDQLESALQEGEKEEEGNKNVKEEDGVEISHDFEGALQDIEKNEDDESQSESDEDEENEELDKQMGETEKDADKLDEKLWGDEEEEEEEDEGEKKDKQDEHGPGDGETTESQIVAKDDNKNREENENQDKKKKKELEVMEEDRRETVEEEEETTYEDNYKDTFGGEDHPDENGEEEPMDLPEDLNLEGNDKDQSDEEPDSEINPEIEEKGLFPEEENEPKEKETGEEGDDDNGKEKEGLDNNTEKEVEDQMDIDEEGDNSDSNRQRMSEELENKGADKLEDGEEKPVPSNDVEATTEAQAADMETKEATKDKTKNNPENATGAQPEEDKDSKQEEQGEIGEQTEDVSGVGQSDSRTKEESHVGETSALTNEDDAKQKMEDQHQPRRPGDQNQTKTLGEVEKEIHRGLLTSKEKQYKEKEESEEGVDSKNNDENENKPENKDSSLYEHIQKADEKFDKQTIDSGSREEAKLVPAPAEEETNEDEEPEGIVDSLMETENEEEAKQKEEARKRQNEQEGNEGADIKRRKREPDPEIENRMNDYETVIEGEAIQELTVQRPISNEIFTQLDEEEVAAIFSDDVASLVENIKHAEDGDVKKGSEQWEDLEGRISSLALQLCEQLRLILEPTEASKLRGDYRTGKRLNMRKVIPYIASQFRKDKIWLRRSQPSKRSYQVLLAVDDSQSMSVLNAGNLARESVALVAKALTLLEVGEVGVISFGEETKVLHPFYMPFSDLEGGKIFGNLNFSQTKSNFDQMLKDSMALFSSARGGQTAHSDTAQLLLILSEGQNHACTKEVKAAVRAAREAGVFIIFLVLDAHDNKYSFCDGLAFVDGKIQSRIETFPFPFFIVVRDLDGLPDAIATALRQWFELVTSDVH